MSKLRLIVNPNPIERAGSSSEPMDGNPQITWQGMCRLRGQLDGIKSAWNADTQPIERCWYIVWSKQLEEAMQIFVEQHPRLKASGK